MNQIPTEAQEQTAPVLPENVADEAPVATDDLPDNRRRLPGEKKEGNGTSTEKAVEKIWMNYEPPAEQIRMV